MQNNYHGIFIIYINNPAITRAVWKQRDSSATQSIYIQWSLQLLRMVAAARCIEKDISLSTTTRYKQSTFIPTSACTLSLLYRRSTPAIFHTIAPSLHYRRASHDDVFKRFLNITELIRSQSERVQMRIKIITGLNSIN